MNKVFLIFFCLLFSFAKGQNLVLNPSFEEYYGCPDNNSQIDSCKYVFNPCSSTSDYFNSCSVISNSVGVPYNFGGFQNARSGKAYAGLFITNIDYQEYIQIKLSSPLSSYSKYNFNLYLSLSNESSYASNCVNVRFLNDSNLYSTSSVLDFLTPDWEYDRSSFIKDTLNWVKINGSYLARGGEKWMVLGCFYGSGLVDTLRVNGNGNGFAYYYVDDVELVESGAIEQSIPNVFTPNNDAINDVWYLNLKSFNNVTCTVYDRWGLKIYETNKPIINWDGYTTSGIECSNGVYYYLISIDEEKKIKGFVQLIR